ncbi:MAG: sensor histidine kinase [Alphaproteobacteria bacterium]
MTTIGKFFRTTAIKLSLIYLAVFAGFAVFLVLYLNSTTTALLTRQLNETVNAEIKGLAEQYGQRGLPGLVALVERRSRQPGANLYLLVNDSGNVFAGNIARISPTLFENVDSEPREIRYRLIEEGGVAAGHTAVVRVFELRGGYKILVGRDVGEREALQEVVRETFFIAGALLVVLGLISWVFVSSRVLKRIDAVSNTTQSIISGDLSRRLIVTGSGDEFDRLALSLNAMLGRIEELMHGLKEVSDNIAHDLKTPLTRLRSRVESALAENGESETYREALEMTIDEADQLIKTFNALLLIARVEAKAPGEVMADLNLSQIVEDVAELYEPMVEEQGMVFVVNTPKRAPVHGNRELISQALANLLDNALKYAPPATERHNGPEPKIKISVANQADETVLTVSDNGPGIEEEARARVLQRFTRLDSSRTQPGSGLGLSLVSAVAGLHNATIDLQHTVPSTKDNGEDHPGRGLSVSIRFPGLQDMKGKIGELAGTEQPA